jgi:hypothetical protein
MHPTGATLKLRRTGRSRRPRGRWPAPSLHPESGLRVLRCVLRRDSASIHEVNAVRRCTGEQYQAIRVRAPITDLVSREADRIVTLVHALCRSSTGEYSQADARTIEREGVQRTLDPSVPICIAFGGEPRVKLAPETVMRERSTGGRTVELALCAVEGLCAIGQRIFLVALATDRDDGTSKAAGALVTNETLERARKRGMDPSTFIARHDSAGFFRALDDLIISGITGTNVNDLVLVFITGRA